MKMEVVGGHIVCECEWRFQLGGRAYIMLSDLAIILSHVGEHVKAASMGRTGL